MQKFHLLIALFISISLIQCNSITGSNSNTDFQSQEETTADKKVTEKTTSHFVTTQNGDFVLEGEPFYFSGTNAYYLPTYEKIDPSLVDKSFDLFEKTGIKVIRMWGFYSGQPKYNNDITLQPEPGKYNETDLRLLDKVIAQAKEHGIRIILTLANYWDQQGGISQYNAWDGNPNGGMKHFINDPDTQRWYKNYIKMLLNRTNSVTGIKYKNDPTIFSWEIINEGALHNGSPAELRDWYQKIARYIKSIDRNHMVSTGEEGLEANLPEEYSIDKYSSTYVLRAEKGSSYKLNTAIPEIDYGTAHWYPAAWDLGKKVTPEMLEAQRAWISDHAKIAKSLGKPFVLGEYGFPGSGSKTFLNKLWQHAEKINLDGNMIWQLVVDKTKCQEFGGNICWPGGRGDKELYQSFADHIEHMNKQ